MKRLAVLVCLLFPSSAAAADPAAVRVAACTSSLELAQRHAVFAGDMRAVRGTARMQMRFTLLARTGQDGWERVAGSKLATWVTSDPGKLRYVYEKRVDGLLAPAGYRVVVRFRWLNADGDAIARARRISRTCHQRDLRPDLRLVGVTATDDGYRVTVRNAGRSAASPFAVSLAVGTGERHRATTGALGAGERASLTLQAPACEPGSTLHVVLDADEQVDEASEADGTVAVPCPARR